MNAWKLYSAIQATERALLHLRHAWEQQDGAVPRTQNRDQQKKEVQHASLFLTVAAQAADEAIKSETPEEPPAQP